MAMTDQARGLAPYFRPLLNDQDVHEHIMRGVRAAQDAYRRGRGKSAAQAAQDRKLHQRLQETAQAARQVWRAVSDPPAKRKPRRMGKALGLAVAVGGTFLAVNTDARAKVLGRLGLGASTPTGSP